MTSFHPMTMLGTKVLVPIYEEMSFCENLSALTPDNIIPVFFHMFFSITGITLEKANATFTSVNFELINQPDDEVQDGNFNAALSLIYLYICALVPKNPGASLSKFLASKELGLINSMNSINLMPVHGNFIVPNNALAVLQDFLGRHTMILGYVFRAFLGISNPEAGHSAQPYAMELLGDLYYANMSSAKLIENYLLTANHPCLIDNAVNGHMRQYLKFKKEAKKFNGENWTMVALLNKPVWLKFARTESHKFLRIVSGMFASEHYTTYDNLMISGDTVAQYKTHRIYRNIYGAYGMNTQGRIQNHDLFGSATTKEIGQKAIAWAKESKFDEDDDVAEN